FPSAIIIGGSGNPCFIISFPLTLPSPSKGRGIKKTSFCHSRSASVTKKKKGGNCLPPFSNSFDIFRYLQQRDIFFLAGFFAAAFFFAGAFFFVAI
ncbi:MAG: hypothetical protein AAB210_02555, partial [Deltaproteobacteria bacterium]